jgi:hypothetical protein
MAKPVRGMVTSCLPLTVTCPASLCCRRRSYDAICDVRVTPRSGSSGCCGRSEKCQTGKSALLFDHLVRAAEQRGRHGEAEGFRGL